MKYFIIAGERSGDLHASGMVSELLKQDPKAEIVGWGGHYMKNAGAEVLTFYHEISFMGFAEVLANLPKIQRNMSQCKRDIREFRPDVLILVDFPGFNLRMAAYARSLGIKTCYYISPKIWAWKKGRIRQIKASVDRMLVILPFEVPFYEKEQYPVIYVGNPLNDAIANYSWDNSLLQKLGETRNLAFLPGSRLQEIIPAIELIPKVAPVYDEFQILVAGVENVHTEVYAPLAGIRNVKVYFGKTYELLKSSEAAVVTSGTATLETALLNVPQVVVYKTNPLTYQIAKRLVKIPFISLVNLIAGRLVVRELIQGDYNPVDVCTELEGILTDESTKKRISEGYSEIQKTIGSEKSSAKAAKEVVDLGRS